MDPFSITSSAAGVVSLGLTVCKGLIQFYDSYKQSGTTVTNLYTQLISLTKTLKLIDGILANSMPQLTHEARSQLEDSIEYCRTAVLELEKKLKKVQHLSQQDIPLPPIGKTKSFIHKASFPFRESTLIRLKEIVLEFRSDLTLVLDALQLDASAVSLQRIEGIDEKLDLVVESTATTTATLLGFGQDIEVMSDILSTNQLDEERNRVYEWLQPPDPFSSHANARSKHERSTNRWLLESEDFSRWVSGKKSLLFLHGIPGCGKTVLASSVIAQLEEDCLRDNSVLLYFYFDFNDRQKQTVFGCLTSLLLQLAVITNNYRFVWLLYTECGHGKHVPPLDDVLDVLKRALSSVDRLYLVFDALDECAEEETFTSLVAEMAREWRMDTKLMMTSRSNPASAFEELKLPCETINIQHQLVDADIQTFIKTRLETNKRLARWSKDPKLKEEIVTTLMEGANGMFRWVAYQLEELPKCLTVASLRQTLKTLPKTLYDTYDRIIQRIDPAYHDMAKQVLQWLCVCQRPLTVIEAAETMAVISEEGSSGCTFESVNRLSDPSDVFMICSNLVASGGLTDVDLRAVLSNPLTLAHYSVREYLASDTILDGPCAKFHLNDSDAHLAVAQSCIAYLMNLGEMADETIAENFPLATYASQHWQYHTEIALETDHDHSLSAMLLGLLESRKTMLKIRQLEKPHYPVDSWIDKPGLHWAAQYGFDGVARDLISKGRDVNAYDEMGRTAVYDAVRFRETKILKLLLNQGAVVNETDDTGISPLHYAIFNEDEWIVGILLKAGADPQLKTGLGRSPLFSAAERGNVAIVKLLLNYRSDPNVRCPTTYRKDSTSLGWPSSIASVNTAEDFLGVTPLQAAVWSGYGPVVKVLLEHGAELLDDGLQLLAEGKVGEAIQNAGKSGLGHNAWHHDMPDYTEIAKILQTHEKASRV